MKTKITWQRLDTFAVEVDTDELCRLLAIDAATLGHLMAQAALRGCRTGDDILTFLAVDRQRMDQLEDAVTNVELQSPQRVLRTATERVLTSAVVTQA